MEPSSRNRITYGNLFAVKSEAWSLKELRNIKFWGKFSFVNQYIGNSPKEYFQNNTSVKGMKDLIRLRLK